MSAVAPSVVLQVRLGPRFDAHTRDRGERYHRSGRVIRFAVDGSLVNAAVQGSAPRPYQVALAIDRTAQRVFGACACPMGLAAIPCKHLWAVLCEAGARGLDLGVDAMSRIRLEIVPAEDDAKPGPPSWRDRLDGFERAVEPRVAGRLRTLEYVVDLPVGEVTDLMSVSIASATVGRSGDVVRRFGVSRNERLDDADRDVIDALAAVSPAWDDGYYYGGYRYQSPQTARLRGVRFAPARATALLERMAATGRLGWLADRDRAPLVALRWDPEPYALVITASKDGGVTATLERGGERVAFDAILGVPCDGVAIVGDQLVRVEADALDAWRRLLASPVIVEADELGAFVERTCRGARPPRLALEDAGWRVVTATPRPRLTFIPPGRGAAKVTGSLAFVYDDVAVPAGASAGLRVLHGERRVVRGDSTAEAALIARLSGAGAAPRADGKLGVAATAFPSIVRELIGEGWDVLVEGKPIRGGGTVGGKVRSGVDWFDLEVHVEYGGASASTPELLAALRAGNGLVRLSDGSLGLLPEAWLSRHRVLLAATREGAALRFARGDALILAALVEGLPEVDVDRGFGVLRDRLAEFDGIAPVREPRGFRGELRSYQREGLGWFAFLRELGFGGCLADDMGLGKTVQVLAMLVARKRTAGPSLVVAPRSLIFNWIDEAARFAPQLEVLEWHGAGRVQRREQLDTANLVLTTYATLRADAGELARRRFDHVILDEAQAIKNARSQTAQAVKLLRADHRLALTGTPVENRLADLASIFDFLNPGMMGKVEALRALETARDSTDARALARVLRPFLLRRTKEQVLTELPGKTEQVLRCRLDRAERARYDELRGHYRESLRARVEADGLGKAKIHVLEALLRLRQAACHPGLLDPARAAEGSAKIDLLVDQLHEVVASGHRALVFSQFTSLLSIVRDRLEREGLAYEYLDGQTAGRKARVDRFQAGSCPVFLLSLKAGGQGLNLTAADYVFLLDPWWNPAVEAQAIDRVHRLGQARPVVAYRLVAEDTVEDKILALQERKRALFTEVFADDAGPLARLTAEDLRALLG